MHICDGQWSEPEQPEEHQSEEIRVAMRQIREQMREPLYARFDFSREDEDDSER